MDEKMEVEFIEESALFIMSSICPSVIGQWKIDNFGLPENIRNFNLTIQVCPDCYLNKLCDRLNCEFLEQDIISC